jgi:hypothetical protein
MPVIPTLWRLRQEFHKCEASLGYILRSCLKEKEKEKKKRAVRMPQVVEYLRSKCEALSSNSGFTLFSRQIFHSV